MTDKEFWLRVWRAMAWMVVGITISIAGCVTADTLVDNAAIADMVQKGSDPQSAACAVKGYERDVRCVMLAAKGVAK